MSIKRVNINSGKDYDYYIGRPTLWGNPFSAKHGTLANIVVNSREESIECYRKWLEGEDFLDFEQEKRKKILENLDTLENKVIACWCEENQSCHGDILCLLHSKKKRIISEMTRKLPKAIEPKDLF